MKQFKIEMHHHTSEVSVCAHVKAADGIQMAADCGYDAVVITDHYTPETFSELAHLSWPQQVDQYLSGYYAALAAAKSLKLTVLPGMEIRFYENWNDYLVYGVNRSFLLEFPHLYKLTIERFSQLCRKQGLLLFQAHPFRNKMTVVDPALLDGIEGLNANPRQDSRNDIAQVWARRHGLATIAGSDFHQSGDQGSSGLLLQQPVRTNQDLVSALRKQAYQILED